VKRWCTQLELFINVVQFFKMDVVKLCGYKYADKEKVVVHVNLTRNDPFTTTSVLVGLS